VPLAPEPQEAALNPQTIIDDDDMHHLVSGLSLEVTRQAERIRRRSHGQDWPGAASAMAELEGDEAPAPELSTGQYL